MCLIVNTIVCISKKFDQRLGIAFHQHMFEHHLTFTSLNAQANRLPHAPDSFQTFFDMPPLKTGWLFLRIKPENSIVITVAHPPIPVISRILYLSYYFLFAFRFLSAR